MHVHGYHYGVAKSSQDYIILFAERVMDIKKLEVFINAVDLGSLTKVAEIMGYTQSGITHVISALEKEMGFPLLLRSRNGVVPTPEGARLIPSIRAMLVHSGQLEKEISLIRQRKDGVIRVAAYTSMLMHWLPPIVKRFHERYPDIAVELSSSSIDGTYKMLEAGDIDLAFASRQKTYPEFDFVHLNNDALMAILPNTEENRSLNCFPISLYKDKDFIMPYFGFDKDILCVFEREKVMPNIEPTYVDDQTVISMVEHGMGISMLSKLVMLDNKSDVISLPVVPEAHRELVLCLKSLRTATEPVKEFINCATEVLDELYGKNR